MSRSPKPRPRPKAPATGKRVQLRRSDPASGLTEVWSAQIEKNNSGQLRMVRIQTGLVRGKPKEKLICLGDPAAALAWVARAVARQEKKGFVARRGGSRR